MLEEKLTRFEDLEKQLLDPDVQGNSNLMAAVAREHGSLAKLIGKYRRFKQLNTEISEAMEMAGGDDAEMRELAEAELPDLKDERENYWNELLDMTIGGEDANRTRCIMEIRSGTGGDEAALFARDLFEMYKYHAGTKGWKIEVTDSNQTDLGGFKELVMTFEGEGVYRELQYESGGHRVQRVPETETKGRIHTSAVTVAVLPEAEEVDVEIKPEEIRVDTFCASGPGGQSV
ncbi:MAG: PCRF domain-containing protein, partial [Pirellulales bacterium]|nr:PCRF domain-containing protein [Pirellulales bacterium]